MDCFISPLRYNDLQSKYKLYSSLFPLGHFIKLYAVTRTDLFNTLVGNQR